MDGSGPSTQWTLDFVGHKLRQRGKGLTPMPCVIQQHMRNVSGGNSD